MTPGPSETSLSAFEFNRSELRHKSTATLAVKARYNVDVTGQLRQIGDGVADVAQVRIRYRDTDGAGTAAQLLLTLHRTNILTGGDEIIYTFDSNAPAPGPVTPPVMGEVNQTVTDCEPGLVFDFENFVYWVDAQLTRTTAAQSVAFAAIQISNNSACAVSSPSL